RYGRVYQINYLRCILCGLCIEACPTRALTMTNEFELADDSREKLIYEKTDLLAPLLPGMEQPPHERTLGDTSRRTSSVCLRRVNRTIVPVTSAMRSRGRSTRAFDTDASSKRRVDDDHAYCAVDTAGHGRGDRLLDACAGDDLGCAWHDPGPQAGAFRSLPRGSDDLPG